MTKEERKKYNFKYNRSKKGLVSKIYGSQKQHSKSRHQNLPTYSKEELKEWLYSQPLFHVLYDNWKRLDFQKMYVPSVDRINSKISYTIANIQLMTWKENYEKGSKEKSSGKNHYSLKPKEYYLTKAIARASFKKTCIIQNWNFCDFLETFSGKTHGTAEKFTKLYYYNFLGTSKC